MISSRLLATDLDGTFIGDTEAMLNLWRDLEDAGILLVFSTGRHLRSIQAFYAEHKVTKRADACICMVGTEIWRMTESSYQIDKSWTEVISEDWDRASVERVLHGIPDVRMQPTEWQSPFKISYFWDGATDSQIDETRSKIDEAGLEAKVVYSAARFLDVIPPRAGKGEAVRHLAQTLRVPPDMVVTAGDTGNDLDMMQPELGFRSIAVGNATTELRDYRTPSLYHATASHAAGIREGLERFGWLDAT